MRPDEAWEAIVPLTRLGQALGELDAVVDVPEDVELLGIPAGPIDVQRLFYWHVVKAYYDRGPQPRRARPHQLRLVRSA